MYVTQTGRNIQAMKEMTKQSIIELEEEKIEYFQSSGETSDTSTRKTVPDSYNYFPVTNLLAQIDCVLQIAQCILKIERVCSIRTSNHS